MSDTALMETSFVTVWDFLPCKTEYERRIQSFQSYTTSWYNVFLDGMIMGIVMSSQCLPFSLKCERI